MHPEYSKGNNVSVLRFSIDAFIFRCWLKLINWLAGRLILVCIEISMKKYFHCTPESTHNKVDVYRKWYPVGSTDISVPRPFQ